MALEGDCLHGVIPEPGKSEKGMPSRFTLVLNLWKERPLNAMPVLPEFDPPPVDHSGAAAARAQLTSGWANEASSESREAKAEERDIAVKRVLAKSAKTLKAALGLKPLASDAEVRKRVRQLLRLLHPDFSMNLELKGTKQHARIESAFKKLNGLRDKEVPS